MKACTSCACSGVAVRPVPIAQTGSYATTACSKRGDAGKLEHDIELARDDFPGAPRLAVSELLTHAQNRNQTLRQRGAEFARDELVVSRGTAAVAPSARR